MDIQLSNVVYDSPNKQTLCSIGGSQFCIPDYMRVSDIEYFINEKVTTLLMASLSMVAAQHEVEKVAPLDKALNHYKELGWEL